MKIVPYQEKYKRDFIEMNKAWISAMFAMEAEDERELGNIEPYIANGGQIFFALDDTDEVMACCMIAPREDGDWEIMKFAARGMYTGTGAGSACLSACINYAKEKGIDKIIIVSNRKCEQTTTYTENTGLRKFLLTKKGFPLPSRYRI